MAKYKEPITEMPPIEFHISEFELFWEHHKRSVLAGVVLLAVIFVAVLSWWWIAKARRTSSEHAFAQAKTIEQWQQITHDFPHEIVTGNAYLLIAQAQRAENKLDASNATLHQFMKALPNHPPVSLGRFALAQNQALAGKVEEAEKTWQTAADYASQPWQASMALYSKAQIELAQSERKEALQTFKQLQANYSKSVLANAVNAQVTALQMVLGGK